jgi:uncharacterized membrane protein
VLPRSGETKAVFFSFHEREKRWEEREEREGERDRALFEKQTPPSKNESLAPSSFPARAAVQARDGSRTSAAEARASLAATPGARREEEEEEEVEVGERVWGGIAKRENAQFSLARFEPSLFLFFAWTGGAWEREGGSKMNASRYRSSQRGERNEAKWRKKKTRWIALLLARDDQKCREKWATTVGNTAKQNTVLFAFLLLSRGKARRFISPSLWDRAWERLPISKAQQRQQQQQLALLPAA